MGEIVLVFLENNLCIIGVLKLDCSKQFSLHIFELECYTNPDMPTFLQNFADFTDNLALVLQTFA